MPKNGPRPGTNARAIRILAAEEREKKRAIWRQRAERLFFGKEAGRDDG